MNHFTKQDYWSFTGHFLTGGVISRWFALLPMMLFMSLLMPASMIAQTTTDSRCDVITHDDGISVEITDEGEYPWVEMNLNELKGNYNINIPTDSKGLMSNNFNKNNSESKSVINFESNSTFVLSFDYAVSSESFDKLYISIDDKKIDEIKGHIEKKYQITLSAGKHKLILSYKKDESSYAGVDRAFIYNVQASIQADVYAAVYDSATKTYTFKKVSADEASQNENVHIIHDGKKVSDLPNSSDLNYIVFDESFKSYTPTTLNSFFNGLRYLKSISGLENLNTAQVKDMSEMFCNCLGLWSTLDLSSLNTGQVTNMYRMFYYCGTAKTIDLSGFNTANVENMDEMFEGCSNLENIFVYEPFNTGKLKSSANMFSICPKLPNYNAGVLDATHANYSAEGYFKKVVGKNGNDKVGAAGEPLAVAELALDDDKDFEAYEPFTATTASYLRYTSTGTTWASLCLPFEVSLEGQNFSAFTLSTVRNDEVVLKELDTTIPAGEPVIIKMNENESKLKFSVADKEIATKASTVAAKENSNCQLVGLYATKMFDKTADNNCYIVKGDKLWNPAKLLDKTSTQTVGSKPFRAYLVDNSSSASEGKTYSFSVDGSTPTALDQLTAALNDSTAVYFDLQGHRLNQPQKGINIVKLGNKAMKVTIK